MSSCSVVMVSFNTGPVLFASIASVLKQKHLAELVLVDNGNPPDVVARLQQMSLSDARLQVLTGGGNVGYGRACNIGVKKATGYFLLLLAPDCLLPPDALSDTMVAFESDVKAVLAGAQLLSANGTPQPESQRLLYTPSYAFGLQRVFVRKQIIAAAPDSSLPHEVPAVSSAFMILRRKDFERIGGHDETFFVHGAGMDLCMRVNRAGGKTMFCPKVKVTKLHSNEESAQPRLNWFRTKALIYYFQKHFADRSIIGLLILVRFALLIRFAGSTIVNWMRREIRPAYVMSHTIPAKRLMVLATGLSELPLKNELYGKTVLVTGATSQIGLCVVRRLIASGAAVLAMSRTDPIPFAHEHLRWIKGDLTDESLHLQGYLVDVVVHCAPLWHLPPTIDLLADADVKRIIAIGSTSIFGKLLSRNAHEKELVEKLSRAEADIAERCALLGISLTTLRPTMVYGAGLDFGITNLTKFIAFLGFFPVYPPAFGRRQPVHVDDIAIAVMQVMYNENTYGKSYNLSGAEVLTYREMLDRLFTVCRRKHRIRESTMLPFLLDVAGWLTGKKHINGEIARRMNDDLMFFHDDARRDFNFSPRNFLSGGMKDIEGY